MTPKTSASMPELGAAVLSERRHRPARTGFAQEGMLDLVKDYDPDRPPLSTRLSSPPVLYKDILICGGGVGEGPEPAAAGHIRGFDARNGKRRWIFHTIPKPGEFGHDTWEGDSGSRPAARITGAV